MGGLIEEIKHKRIVIWGVGAMQTDIEALFSFDIVFYIDEQYDQKKDRISALRHPIRTPDYLKEEDKDNLFVILCEQEYGEIQHKLDLMGLYENTHFASYERILFDCDLQKIMRNLKDKRIVIWGIGKTFADYCQYLSKGIPQAEFYVDDYVASKCTQYNGKEVLTFEGAKDKLQNTFVMVTSSYYPKIADKLIKIGKKPCEDFIYVDTYRVLYDYFVCLSEEYTFVDRKKDAECLLVVLAGYKPKLWDCVFTRLKSYVPVDYDVCVSSSGLFDTELDYMCEKHGWSYLSTVQNKISMIVNLSIYLHKNAKYIIKLDEDIFVTEEIFSKLQKTYAMFEDRERYQVGFVSPLIPVNTYGYIRILEKLHLEKEWEARFGELKYSDGLTHHLEIIKNPKAAMFMWGDEQEELRNIDLIAAKLGRQPMQYSICPTRYSIGMILFSRDNWIGMKLFPMTEGNNLGADEEHICKYCLMSSRAIVIAENSVVGHLGYGPQTEEMMLYYEANQKEFMRTNFDR